MIIIKQFRSFVVQNNETNLTFVVAIQVGYQSRLSLISLKNGISSKTWVFCVNFCKLNTFKTSKEHLPCLHTDVITKWWKGKQPTWKMVNQAPIEAAALGAGRRIVVRSFSESDLISTRLFCTKQYIPLIFPCKNLAVPWNFTAIQCLKFVM